MNLCISSRFALTLLAAVTLIGVTAAAFVALRPAKQPLYAPPPRMPVLAQVDPERLPSVIEQAIPAPSPAPYAAPISPPPLQLAPERTDIVAVRREITALRMACAAMPMRTYAAGTLPMRSGVGYAPVSITTRPHAAEEDTCEAVLSPERAGPGYAIELGMIGAGLTVLALMFFTLVGGVLRVLWHGPMARTFPALVIGQTHR